MEVVICEYVLARSDGATVNELAHAAIRATLMAKMEANFILGGGGGGGGGRGAGGVFSDCWSTWIIQFRALSDRPISGNISVDFNTE